MKSRIVQRLSRTFDDLRSLRMQYISVTRDLHHMMAWLRARNGNLSSVEFSKVVGGAVLEDRLRRFLYCLQMGNIVCMYATCEGAL